MKYLDVAIIKIFRLYFTDQRSYKSAAAHHMGEWQIVFYFIQK